MVFWADRFQMEFAILPNTGLGWIIQSVARNREIPLHSFRLFLAYDEVKEYHTPTMLGIEDVGVFYITHRHGRRERKIQKVERNNRRRRERAALKAAPNNVDYGNGVETPSETLSEVSTEDSTNESTDASFE